MNDKKREDYINMAGICLTKSEHARVIFGYEDVAKKWEEEAKNFFDLSEGKINE